MPNTTRQRRMTFTFMFFFFFFFFPNGLVVLCLFCLSSPDQNTSIAADPPTFLFLLPLLLATYAKVYVFVTKDLDWSEMTLFLFVFFCFSLSLSITFDPFATWLHYGRGWPGQTGYIFSEQAG